MSLRSLRAAAPVSSSASTTMRPLTMCSPPAKRSIEETSDLRQHDFVTVVLASSALTCVVIAIRPILPPTAYLRIGPVQNLAVQGMPVTLCLAQEARIGPGQLLGIVPGGPVIRGQVGDQQIRPKRGDHGPELVAVDDRPPVGEHDVELEPRGVTGEDLQVFLRGE